VGIRLRQIRERRGLTQLQLSTRSGVAQSTISQYETGTRSATLKTLRSLAGVLQCKPWELVEGASDLETVEDCVAVLEERLGWEPLDNARLRRVRRLLEMLREEIAGPPSDPPAIK
jgi:transcriptional regulator with XRE-family HTH domain